MSLMKTRTSSPSRGSFTAIATSHRACCRPLIGRRPNPFGATNPPPPKLRAATRRQRDAHRMDFHISAEQRQMVASVRELAQSEFKPKAGRWMDGTLPVGEHEAARRTRRARHVGAGGIWRPRPAGLRHRADPRGDRQGLLRHRDGGARRGRRADPRHRALRARGDQATASCRGRAAATACWRSA